MPTEARAVRSGSSNSAMMALCLTYDGPRTSLNEPRLTNLA